MTISTNANSNQITADLLVSTIKSYKLSLLTDILQNAISEKTKDRAIAFILKLKPAEIDFICSEPEYFLEYLWNTRTVDAHIASDFI